MANSLSNMLPPAEASPSTLNESLVDNYTMWRSTSSALVFKAMVSAYFTAACEGLAKSVGTRIFSTVNHFYGLLKIHIELPGLHDSKLLGGFVESQQGSFSLEGELPGLASAKKFLKEAHFLGKHD